MICRKIDGHYLCEAESRLFFILREFEIGRRYHFPLVLAKTSVLIFCLFLTSHVHNDVSKQFLLAVCAPVAAEIAMNVVVNVLYFVDYFPDQDTVAAFMKLQRTFEVVVCDIFVLSSCAYMIFNLCELKKGKIMKKTTHISVFQSLVIISSIIGVLLTLTQKELTKFSFYYLVYHIFVAILVLSLIFWIAEKNWKGKIGEKGECRSRLLSGLLHLTFLTLPVALALLFYTNFEEILRLCLKMVPLVVLPMTVLFLPAFRELFICWRRPEVSKIRPPTPGWTENQYRIEKTAQGIYIVLPPCSQQTRIPLKPRTQLPDYSKLPYQP